MHTKTLVAIVILVLLFSMAIGIPIAIFSGYGEYAGLLGMFGGFGLVMLLVAHSEM